MSKPWESEGGLNAGLGSANKSSRGSSNLRYWMPKGEERKIIFLTEGNKAPIIWEHQVRLSGDWRNWFPSLEWLGISPDPLKEFSEETNQFKRYTGYAFTIIDTHEFTDRQGNKRSNLKKIMIAKRDTAEILKRLYQKRLDNDEGLRGAMFNVYRTNSDKSAAVGEQFEFEKMVDLSAFEDTEEFDWSEVFAPNAERQAEVVAQLRREMGLSSGDKNPEGTSAKVEY